MTGLSFLSFLNTVLVIVCRDFADLQPDASADRFAMSDFFFIRYHAHDDISITVLWRGSWPWSGGHLQMICPP